MRRILAQLTTLDALIKACVNAMVSKHDRQCSSSRQYRRYWLTSRMTTPSSDCEVDQEACRCRRRQRHASARGQRQRRGGRRASTRHKKIEGKKERGFDRLLQQMGKAPSLLLPLNNPTTTDDDDCGVAQRRMALAVPIALLLPDCCAQDLLHASLARELMSTWDRLIRGGRNRLLSASSAPTVIVVLLRSGRFALAVFSLAKVKMYSTTAMTMITGGLHESLGLMRSTCVGILPVLRVILSTDEMLSDDLGAGGGRMLNNAGFTGRSWLIRGGILAALVEGRKCRCGYEQGCHGADG